jgi:hypothetical protein
MSLLSILITAKKKEDKMLPIKTSSLFQSHSFSFNKSESSYKDSNSLIEEQISLLESKPSLSPKKLAKKVKEDSMIFSHSHAEVMINEVDTWHFIRLKNIIMYNTDNRHQLAYTDKDVSLLMQ